MKRKRKIEEPENPDRWVVSYADFITLLFAFFTTMYAISQVDQGKLARFSGSMKSAFKVSKTDAINTSVIEGIRPINYPDVSLEREIQTEFGKFNVIEAITISRDQRGVVLSFGDTSLFDSGSTELRKDARPLLSAAATLIKRNRRAIVIEGHTDNLPLRSTVYSTNIELSTARASRVYSYFLDEQSVKPERLAVAGYGEYRPTASNATVEGRARNRRVDIIFVAKDDGQ